jgi:hypothetical protein
MRWSAEVVSEPSMNHRLCVDLFETGVHRGRIQWNDRNEVDLVFYGDCEIAVPADWLIGIVQRFKSETTTNGAR